MSAPVADAASPGGASHPAKKRKLDGELPSVWVGGYDKKEADRVIAALEAKQAELAAELARARADAKAAALQNAEEVAALKAKFDRVHSLAARYQRERDTARAERDAASSERDARAQERDEGAKEFAAELERCKASAKEAATKAEQKYNALAKQLKDVTESRDWVHKENDRMTNDLDDLQGEFNDLREKYKGAAAELERCKASAKEAAAQAAQKYDELVGERDAARAQRDTLTQQLFDSAKKLAEFVKLALKRKDEVAQAQQRYKMLETAEVQRYDALAKERDDWRNLADDLQEKYKKCKKECDDWKEHADDLDERNDHLYEKLAEATEECKTARELGRREAEADLAAAKARADNAVKSLQAELAKSKSLEEELESVKAQLGTAKERLGQIAAFQRQQARMSAMMMNSGFMNLEDAAFPPVPAGSSAEVQAEEGEMGEILHVD